MPRPPFVWVRFSRRAAFACAAVVSTCAFTCGCGGGGGGPSPASFVSTPAPTPTPTAPPSGALMPSATTEALTLAGQTATVSITESGYAGTVTADASACSNVASVAPSSASAPATFTITASGSGTCTLSFTDAYGQRATVAVGVTITQGTVR